MIDFTKMDVNTLANGVTGEGVKYLQLFLQEYTSIFSETVNPSCNKCLTSYLDKYKKKMAKTNNTTGYVLQPKYVGMPLEFGSQTMVTNENLTEEMAKKILARPNGEKYFSKLPEAVTSGDSKPKAEKAKKPRKKKNEGVTAPEAPAETVTEEATTEAPEAVNAGEPKE